MEFIKKYGFWIFITVLAVYLGYRKWPHQIEIKEIQIIQGNELRPITVEGDSALIVHYFTSWCGPCMKELPEWGEHKHELNLAGFKVVCITDDSPEIVERLRATHMMDIERTESLNALNVFSIPTTYIYNKEGRQVQRTEGPLNWSNPLLVEELKKFK